MFSLEKRKPVGSNCCLQSLKEELEGTQDPDFFLERPVKGQGATDIATQGIMNLVLGKVSFTRVVKHRHGLSHAVSIPRDSQSSATQSLVQPDLTLRLAMLYAGDETT